jgi:hypothetical protein
VTPTARRAYRDSIPTSTWKPTRELVAAVTIPAAAGLYGDGPARRPTSAFSSFFPKSVDLKRVLIDCDLPHAAADPDVLAGLHEKQSNASGSFGHLSDRSRAG